MNEIVVFKAFAIALLMLAAPSAYAEQRFQKLSAAQIRAKFSGMELTDEVHWYDLYARNGTVLSSSRAQKAGKVVGPEGPAMHRHREGILGQMLRRSAIGK